MSLQAPAWLWLVPVLALLGWSLRGLQLQRPLRVLCLALWVLLLAGPQVQRSDTALDLWVLVDRSASAEDLIEPRRAEWEALIEKGKGARDRVFYVDFANEAMVRAESDRSQYAGDRQQTRIALATHHALALMDRDRANRLLLLSDGYSSESLHGLAERLVNQQVPLDVRRVTPPDVRDVRVGSFRLPAAVQLGEPFLIEGVVLGDADVDVPYDLYRHNVRVAQGVAAVRGGEGPIRLVDRLLQPGSHRYEWVLHPTNDAFAGNNQAQQWVEVTTGPRVLLISQFADDPLAAMLRAQGFPVELVTDPAQLHAGRLTGARVVILNQMPAYRMPPGFLDAFDFHVRMQGAGLMMAGGPLSFGSGGYFESALDPLLPVSMELKDEHRKFQVAMAVVMDRSGSMGAGVPGAGGGVTKMDLANEGTARVIELLGDRDAITVFAVDSSPHTVVPLTSVGPVRGELIDSVRRITSGGGGIYVYTGLNAAWEELRKSPSGQRHVILFTDAADSEEPGDYAALIGTMVEQGATISVIGLGTEQDPDAEFIQDVARRGNGRIFFNANASELPTIFAQEAVSVARSAFLEEPTPAVPTAGWLELAAKAPAWMPHVDGYNLSYLRPEASSGLLTGDDYAAPLVSFWQRGMGRAAAVTFPLAGEHSGAVRAWPGYGDFVQTLGRWLMGQPQPPGLGLRHALEGSTLRVDLLYDETWEERVGKTPPALFILREGEDVPVEAVWERMEPGRYQAVLDLPPGVMVRGVVQVGEAALSLGPVTAGLSPEWAFSRERWKELEDVVRLSGGEKRTDLGEIWSAPRRTSRWDLRGPLLILFMGALLMEALVTRMGWALPRFALPSRAGSWRRKRPAAAAREVPPPLPEVRGPAEVEPTPTAEPAIDEEERRRRFHRAKRRPR